MKSKIVISLRKVNVNVTDIQYDDGIYSIRANFFFILFRFHTNKYAECTQPSPQIIFIDQTYNMYYEERYFCTIYNTQYTQYNIHTYIEGGGSANVNITYAKNQFQHTGWIIKEESRKTVTATREKKYSTLIFAVQRTIVDPHWLCFCV